VASAFPYGAGTCLSDQMIIEGVAKSPMGKLNASLGYDFKVCLKNNQYIPKGPPIFLEITGKKKFRGLLLYALDSAKNHVGQWTPPHGFKFKTNCTGDPKGTLTHRNPSKKRPGTKFKWRPPPTDVGPITFVGTIVISTQEGFQIVKTQQVFTAFGSNNTINANSTNVPTPPNATAIIPTNGPSSTVVSSNSISTPLNDNANLTAVPISKSSRTFTIVESLGVQSCLIASLTIWYLFSAMF
ncbi:10860_t:CDS:2, partial [Cetraspora pellucida]